MKKFFLALLCLLLAGCGERFVNPTYKPETYNCDMSSYNGLNSVDHMFVGTTVNELEKFIENKGNGVFVFSRKNCDHCQMVMRYLNDVAKEKDVTIYYIDGANDSYPIIGTDNYDRLYSILFEFLNEGDEGREIQTPHVFTIINGEIKDSKIGTTWSGKSYGESDVNELKDLYRRFLTPFSK